MKIVIIEKDARVASELESVLAAQNQVLYLIGKVQGKKALQVHLKHMVPDAFFINSNQLTKLPEDFFSTVNELKAHVVLYGKSKKHALEVIQRNLVDYLSIPFESVAINRALQRILDRMKMQMIIQNTYKKASQTGAAPLGNTIMVYDNERLNPIDINKIIKIKAQGAYSEIYVQGAKKILTSKHLAVYERALNDKSFIRIHDACLINAEHVTAYKPGVNAKVQLKDNTYESVSKRKKKVFLNFFRA
jgi:two-component system LytT family response regulator